MHHPHQSGAELELHHSCSLSADVPGIEGSFKAHKIEYESQEFMRVNASNMKTMEERIEISLATMA